MSGPNDPADRAHDPADRAQLAAALDDPLSRDMIEIACTTAVIDTIVTIFGYLGIPAEDTQQMLDDLDPTALAEQACGELRAELAT